MELQLIISQVDFSDTSEQHKQTQLIEKKDNIQQHFNPTITNS